ncbi:MAG: hypothetical protein ACE5JL_15760 [Dehalococcoidia bacterium]
MSPGARTKSGPQGKSSRRGDDTSPHGPDPVQTLKEGIRQGRPWHLALLEAAGMWALASEERDGRTYRYLLAGEAFDWLLLAERLCCELDGLIPAQEREELLFSGRLPQEVDAAQMEKLLGFTKYRAYMNYWYGVVVEEALQLAMEEEARKEHRAGGRSGGDLAEETAWERLYRQGRDELLRRFRQEAGYPLGDSSTLAEMKEFTYWLFKLRVASWDPARVASDTRKALDRLDALRGQV